MSQFFITFEKEEQFRVDSQMPVGTAISKKVLVQTLVIIKIEGRREVANISRNLRSRGLC